MGPATDLATKAADLLFQYQVLGILVVVMAIGWVVTIVAAWRIIEKKNAELIATHVAHGKESLASRDGLVAAAHTMDKVVSAYLTNPPPPTRSRK